MSAQDIIIGLCLRSHFKAQQFRRMKLPNHELYYITHSAVQGGSCIHLWGGENERKTVSFECFCLFISLIPSECNSVVSLKRTGKWDALRVDDEALPWRVVVTAFWTTWLYLSVSEGKRDWRRSRFTTEWEKSPGRALVIRWKRDYRWTAPRRMTYLQSDDLLCINEWDYSRFPVRLLRRVLYGLLGGTHQH